MRNIKRIIEKIIVIVLVIFLCVVLFKKYVLKQNPVKLNGYSILIVSTQSMKNTIDEDELIIIKQCDNYELNQIVTYKYFDGTLITHRIVQIDEYIFVAKGDNNEIVDEYANVNQIEGKVIFHSKILGIFIKYFLKFIVLINLFILFLVYMKKYFYAQEVDNEEKEE